MRPYGIQRRDHADVDTRGAIDNGRATAIYAHAKHGGDARAHHALRGGKKAARRRALKRRARAEARAECVFSQPAG